MPGFCVGGVRQQQGFTNFYRDIKKERHTMTQQFLFQITFLLPLGCLVGIFFVLRRRGILRLFGIVLALVFFVVVYARFVEPHILIARHHNLSLSSQNLLPETEAVDVRIAVFSDPHIGVFKNHVSLERIVKTVETSGADLVLVPGDWVYHATDDQIKDHFRHLSELSAPVFAVLGNHDVGFPGPDASSIVISELRRQGVHLVENKSQEVIIRDGCRIVVAGVSDLWQDRQDFKFEKTLPDDAPTILVTHNPDTVMHVPSSLKYDLMVAGHTHGGQIRIPILYNTRIPTDLQFDKDLHYFQTLDGTRPVFVSAGTGMVVLPFRLFVPPRVDILDLRLSRAAADC